MPTTWVRRATDVADAIEQMWEKRRYHELFFMIDTCQASSMTEHIYSPNVLAVGSSVVGQNSYSVRCVSDAVQHRQRRWSPVD